METTIPRPSNKDSDEDLLKQQEQFLKQKLKSSAQVVEVRNKKPDVKPVTESVQQEEKISLDDSPEGCVQLDIKEHIGELDKIFTFETPVSSQSGRKINTVSERKKKSIFAQKHENNVTLNEENKETCSSDNNFDCEKNVRVHNVCATPETREIEMQRIHEENVAKISQMSKETILEYQEELKKHLNPEVLNFIKNRKNRTSKDKSAIIKPVETHEDCPRNKPFHKNENIPEDDKVLRKEGSEDRDAIILKNTFENDFVHLSPVKETEAISDGITSKVIELPEETQELLESGNKGQWLHMNNVEKVKLEWMSKLPKPEPLDLKTGYVARFDFEGKVLARDSDTPTTQGLHHHSNEPEVAGYSLEELFLLSRSSLQSQRITALQTIARILENNWLGKLDHCFDTNLLQLFLQSGIVPLLRWALDDTTASSISVAISAIHSLLINKADELCLDRAFFWLNGHVLPQLEAEGIELSNALEELTDADLIKLDVVKGWLRIDVLARFRYLFSLPVSPPPSVCQLMLEICTRLAQHSVESAEKVVSHPGFMEMIFRKFLPISWPNIDINQWNSETNFVYPSYSGMKLIRIIASSNKERAVILVNNYNLLDSIRCYLVIQPGDATLPLKDVQKLMVESLKTWQILLTYGLASEIYYDLFPIFLRQFDFCQSLSLKLELKKHICDFEYATAFFKALEAVVVVAAHQSDSLCTSSTRLCWDHVSALLIKAETCLKKWLWEFPHSTPSMVTMDLLGACLNFISTFYKKSHENLICEESNACRSAKEVFQSYLLPCLSSTTFKSLLEDISSYSVLLKPDSGKRDAPTLISLSTILWRDDVVPILKEDSPFSLLSAVLNYVIVHKSLFSDEENKVSEVILCGSMREYLKALLVAKSLNSENWFSHFELHFVCQLIELSSQTSHNQEELVLWHQLASTILPCFKVWNEWLLKELLENVIFNEKYFMFFLVRSHVLNLSVADNGIIQTTKARLPVISSSYINCFLDINDVEQSRCLYQRNMLQLQSVSFQVCSKPIVPKYWSYYPILNLYQKFKNNQCSDAISGEKSLKVIHSLQWTHTCNVFNLANFKHIPSYSKFYYLNLVFLLDSEFFRDDVTKQLLQAHIVRLIEHEKKINIDKRNWKDAPPYDDVYLEMLVQFESVSYGDYLFSNFVLIPMQQSYSYQWKKVLLSEHSQALRFLGVPLSKLLVPVENYLDPLEKKPEVLMLYLHLLLTGHLNSNRCPLVYLMAIHHLHGFIFEPTEQHLNYQKLIISKILKTTNSEIKRLVLLYSGYSKEEPLGFSQKMSLSSEQQAHLESICGISAQL